MKAAKEESGTGPRDGVFPLPCELPPEHCFRFRKIDVAVGGVLDGQLTGNEVQDEAEVSGSSAVKPYDRGKNPAAMPELVEFRFDRFPWQGTVLVSIEVLVAFVVHFVNSGLTLSKCCPWNLG